MKSIIGDSARGLQASSYYGLTNLKVMPFPNAA